MKTVDEIIKEEIGIRIDAKDLTPMDKGECKRVAIKYADQFQSKQSLTDITDEEIHEADKLLREYYTKNKEGKGAGFAIRLLKSLSKSVSKEPSVIDPTDEQKEQFKKAMAEMDKNYFVVIPCYDVDPVKFAEWLAHSCFVLTDFKNNKWLEIENERDEMLTTAELLELYKQSLIQE